MLGPGPARSRSSKKPVCVRVKSLLQEAGVCVKSLLPSSVDITFGASFLYYRTALCFARTLMCVAGDVTPDDIPQQRCSRTFEDRCNGPKPYIHADVPALPAVTSELKSEIPNKKSTF
ncbi:hypothetical protein Pmani_021597 [Petrolisthes manimaculis]|uniref:Uncharacterized protein n=1 Tax=Petrolisthes manimaculis TaxID=1843537 RepID=A0AAE1U553_9EUCA|nr:hypothetical protein Pmani_021597 [Petrolisthes manimaculis]